MMEHAEALRMLTQHNVPLPLVSVDGKPTFAGGISIGIITEELEKLGLVPLESPGVSSAESALSTPGERHGRGSLHRRKDLGS